MSNAFARLVALVVAGTVSGVFADSALAGRDNRQILVGPEQNLSDTFGRAITDRSRDGFSSLSYSGQLDNIFGISGLIGGRGLYPENAIEFDARTVHILYLDGMQQQNSQDPIIRTRDLPNPYDSSLVTERASVIFAPAGEEDVSF
ncbi:hypothetical protein KR51_00018640 [Rubidibacter lacunae KORDI 51-2]|uniref:Uncharacterized protein n=1 Tax=Rubidibacter lacunae KORDI 51-2 TaxID=582515 RepID=U5DIY6_9CHRO|nr:hypothetical protein [Rubidibacter lacunae]ERN41636.1 hypothetical protein KR51_00018640 [Rubidibacter lacunae KORDI 51-2]